MENARVENESANRLVAIDGHNYLWRSYSVPFKFNSVRGTPLHVAAAFLKLLRRSVGVIPNMGRNDRLVIVFDSEAHNANFALSEDYKANRRLDFTDIEDSPFVHLPIIKKILNHLNIGYIEQEGTEADDVIATLSREFTDKYGDGISFIFSSDSDFYQLIDKKTSIIKLKARDQYEVIDEAFILQKLGIMPDDYVYFKSLTGDRTDNIRGIEGIGPIAAREIILGRKIFDFNQYTDVLALNHQLIQLNTQCQGIPDVDEFLFDPSNLAVSNSQIFNLCEF